jgi:AraC-like DNA-binding protein
MMKANCNKDTFLIKSNSAYKKSGATFAVNQEMGAGYCWVYEYMDLYSVIIYDFSFHKDQYLEMSLPDSYSFTYYLSVSGEEFTPCQKLQNNSIRFYNGGETYKAVYHANYPLKSISIALQPKYLDDFLAKRFPDNPLDLRCLFKNSNTLAFSELAALLHQLYIYDGQGIEAQMYFDSKLSESLFLIVKKYTQEKEPSPKKIINSDDLHRLDNVTEYIKGHYAFDLRLSLLANIACMSPTKLKTTFKQIYGCTVTDYIQRTRIQVAEHMMLSTDLSLHHISAAIGYQNPSRFSELFKRINGILPSEYRNQL